MLASPYSPYSNLRVKEAAAYWLCGEEVPDLMKRFRRSRATIYRWKQTEAWQETVRGKTRLPKPKPLPSRFQRDLCVLAAELWLIMGKPSIEELAYKGVRITFKPLTQENIEFWMSSITWERAIAAKEAFLTENGTRTFRETKRPINQELLRRTCYLSVFEGYSDGQIAKKLGKHRLTILRWRQTYQWRLEFEYQNYLFLYWLCNYRYSGKKIYEYIIEEKYAKFWDILGM